MLNSETIRKIDAGHKRASAVNDGQQWLDEMAVRMRKTKPICEIVTLTPSMATALLAVNPDNRTINQKTVEAFAADIVAGRWAFNGESIILADTGELNDGQHRCAAVVLAGQGIKTTLVAGVPREVRTTTDMGRQRTTGHFLHMHKVEKSNAVAAAAGMVFGYENGLLIEQKENVKVKAHTSFIQVGKRPTKQQILEFATKNIVDFNRALAAIDSTKAGVVSSYSRFVAMLCIIARRTKDWKSATDFIVSVVNGDDLKRGSAEYATRERLLLEKRQGLLGPIRFMEIVARGWNAYRVGQRVNRFNLSGTVPPISR